MNEQSKPDKDSAKPHEFNDRLFCKNCGADAIGLRGKGKDAMVCRG